MWRRSSEHTQKLTELTRTISSHRSTFSLYEIFIKFDGCHDYLPPYDSPINDVESFKTLLELAGLRRVEIHDGIGLDISEPNFRCMLRAWPNVEAMYSRPRNEAWYLSHSISLADLD